MNLAPVSRRADFRAGLAALVLLTVGAQARADDDAFSYSGFLSVVAGRSFGACSSAAALNPSLQAACTRYIADYAHDGVYTPSWSLSPESRAGIQATERWLPTLSGTVQVTARGDEGQHLNLEWAYLNYQPSPNWTLQVGRKRLPLYYYSDSEDIGLAYNTVRPSPDVYGWDIVNYDGASLSYAADVESWSLRTELLAGTETSDDNPYQRIYMVPKQNVQWSDIRGLSFEFSRDWLSGRLSYLTSNYRDTDQAAGPVVLFNGRTSATQRFMGAALNADFGNWVLRGEGGGAWREAVGYKARFYLLSAGYRIDKFTPTLGYSTYRESTPIPTQYTANNDNTLSLAVRYELHKNGDLKVQLDRLRDEARPSTLGSSNAVSVAYDLVF